jgi:hypothetical protein
VELTLTFCLGTFLLVHCSNSRVTSSGANPRNDR